MSDIYEQKARKYKYKYLKLKQEYIGEGGVKLPKQLEGLADYINKNRPSFWFDKTNKTKEIDKEIDVNNLTKLLEFEGLADYIKNNDAKNLKPKIEIINNKINEEINLNNLRTHRKNLANLYIMLAQDNIKNAILQIQNKILNRIKEINEAASLSELLEYEGIIDSIKNDSMTSHLQNINKKIEEETDIESLKKHLDSISEINNNLPTNVFGINTLKIILNKSEQLINDRIDELMKNLKL